MRGHWRIPHAARPHATAKIFSARLARRRIDVRLCFQLREWQAACLDVAAFIEHLIPFAW